MKTEKIKMFKKVIFDMVWLKYYDNVYYDDVIRLADNITEFFRSPLGQQKVPTLSVVFNENNSVTITIKNSDIIENTEFKTNYHISLYNNYIFFYECDTIEFEGVILYLDDKSYKKTLEEIINN